MAEAVVNRHGKDRFQAFSAGVEPTTEADPVAVEVLAASGYPTENLRPKHWREFAGAGAPVLDFVFTLSDTASRDAFPEWPGKPAASHWRYPDPTKSAGDDWQRKREYDKKRSARGPTWKMRGWRRLARPRRLGPIQRLLGGR